MASTKRKAAARPKKRKVSGGRDKLYNDSRQLKAAKLDAERRRRKKEEELAQQEEQQNYSIDAAPTVPSTSISTAPPSNQKALDAAPLRRTEAAGRFPLLPPLKSSAPPTAPPTSSSRWAFSSPPFYASSAAVALKSTGPPARPSNANHSEFFTSLSSPPSSSHPNPLLTSAPSAPSSSSPSSVSSSSSFSVSWQGLQEELLADVSASLQRTALPFCQSLIQQLQRQTADSQEQRRRAEAERRRAEAILNEERQCRVELSEAKAEVVSIEAEMNAAAEEFGQEKAQLRDSVAASVKARHLAEVALTKAKEAQAAHQKEVDSQMADLRRAFEEEKAALMKERDDAIAGRATAEKKFEEKDRAAQVVHRTCEGALEGIMARDRELEVQTKQLEEKEGELRKRDGALEGLQLKFNKLCGHYNQLVEDHEGMKVQVKALEQSQSDIPTLIPSSSSSSSPSPHNKYASPEPHSHADGVEEDGWVYIADRVVAE